MSKVFETPLYPYRRSPDQDAAAPVRHPVIVVGAGPVGLTLAIDLCLHGIPVVVLDENEKVSRGSRAICVAKRALEILDRLGCGQAMVDRGVGWSRGRVFVGEHEIYSFELQPEGGHRRPAFINLQQYHVERMLVERLRVLEAAGRPIDLRGHNRVTGVSADENGATVTVETPEGPYGLACDWLVACDGADSPVRTALGLGFIGRVFEDNFLIADVVMEADFPAVRRFWFDPPFNRGQSALMHKQPDKVWRVDLQLGHGIDKEVERQPERVTRRLRSMLGPDVAFEYEWISIYTFQCRRMERFRHGRVLFAGDAAHQVSPFGARGANSGMQDADNLAWKLAWVIARRAPDTLLDSYHDERAPAADENIRASSRSTDFLTPKSHGSRVMRDAVLALASRFSFARPLVNSGRLSVPSIYDGSPLNGPDTEGLPARTRPGTPASDAPLGNGWLLERLQDQGFALLTIDTPVPDAIELDDGTLTHVALGRDDDATGALADRYLGTAGSAIYLIRPDQHIAARWTTWNGNEVRAALALATGRGGEAP